MFLKLMAGAILTLAVMGGTAHALTLQQVGGGFEEPIYVTSDPGNPERLFVVERKGTVELVQNGEVKPFADIRSVVSCCEGERGLLSIALAPDFDLSGRFFLYYTGKEEPGEIHVGEMVASGGSAPFSTLHNVIPPILHPNQSNHDGGQLQFGPEGALFFATGDGGGEDDQDTQRPEPDQGTREAAAAALTGTAEETGNLEPRPAQSLPLLLRPAHRRSLDRRRRAERTRGGRLRRRPEPGTGRQLRLELHGGRHPGAGDRSPVRDPSDRRLRSTGVRIPPRRPWRR